ncbi:AAA domain-containing protein [Pontibacter sp. E15-1]|uniref:AAA domain-containing protein n=1 Tax=Pontibacter sp. E15-1 TaxID=2919918 RepID=UPI001F4F9445|nr:AAA domain-containing protein [Pontibacter sp. E15-1]MCJ8163998.1 AAA domain-containing protein [Pontibacter sp. E15-1]
MKNILKTYRRRLLNLGSSNRALLLLRLSREMHLDVETLDFLNGEPAFSVIDKLLSGKKKISLTPYADSRHAPVAPTSKHLRYIRRKAGMVLEERGTRELYIGWPFVHGRFSDGTAVRSPLLFFPVQLQVNAAQEWELVPDTTQAAQFNQSFLLAYAHYMGTPLAEALTELDLSTLPHHPLEFRTEVYELLKLHQLQLTVGREFFADKLIPFREYKKAEFEEAHQPGQLHLAQEAVLGLYPQAASYLLSDYDELLTRDGLQDMQELFASAHAAPSPAINQAQQTFTVFAMDASQEAALQAVKQGKSLVVQGPPGTGKSQLICNLVSDYTARGKKVLVVSQKRAALDVVYQRLSQKGLGAFTGLVHDINTDKGSIYTQLLSQIEAIDEYKKQNLALNSIYTDRQFLEVSRGINRCVLRLDSFKQALFDTSRCGWSAKELYLRSSLGQPHIQLPTDFRHFTAATISEFLPRLRHYLQQAVPFQQENFIWKERHSMKGYGWPERQQLEQAIKALPAQYAALRQEISRLSGYTFTLENFSVYKVALHNIATLQKLLQPPEVQETVRALLLGHAKPEELRQQVAKLQKLYLASAAPDGMVTSIQQPALRKAIAAYGEQRSDWLKSIGWFFSQERRLLQQALALYRQELSEENVAQLQQRLALRQEAQEQLQLLNKSANYNLQVTDPKEMVLQKLEAVGQALEALKLLRQLNREKVLAEKMLPTVTLETHLKALRLSIHDFAARYSEWQKWLPEAQVKAVIAREQHGEKLLQELQKNFEVLVAHDTVYAALTKPERAVAELMMAECGGSAEEGEKLFLNSLYLAWINELEATHPELRMPSNGELERLEAELQELLQEKQRLSEEIVLSQLREQTYRNLEHNRLGNAVTYRRLQAQVSKKRSLYPLRKLFSLFSTEMLDLVPCWLASPETVSAVLPLEACFDLVIFDEASQCFAESGLPAMQRARQVVVAGDEQQLKPSDVYRTRWSATDQEEVEELSAESLLQLCSLYLPQTMLTQHYRSRYPELIEFSNRHFYRHKLELIPEREDANARTPAIRFVKVHGLWQDNTNLPEAERVVELVLQALEGGQEEIGVITFNYAQQMLVQDLLEEKAREQGINLPATVLVKNIENIQGDEKEVIILSVGYAPDAQGRLAMQFGSLNQAGGENRLNVAITRARQQVLVVSSIRAEQLQVEHTLHRGPKLLQAYLQYAQQVSRRYFAYKPKQTPFAAQVPMLKELLQQEVSTLHRRVPFADLTQVQGKQYTAVVLTDDDLYHSHLSVRHSHADLPQLLRLRHWPFTKVYSRQFWADTEEVLRRLKAL